MSYKENQSKCTTMVIIGISQVWRPTSNKYHFLASYVIPFLYTMSTTLIYTLQVITEMRSYILAPLSRLRLIANSAECDGI